MSRVQRDSDGIEGRDRPEGCSEGESSRTRRRDASHYVPGPVAGARGLRDGLLAQPSLLVRAFLLPSWTSRGGRRLPTQETTRLEAGYRNGPLRVLRLPSALHPPTSSGGVLLPVYEQ
ncbi:hypothetical protein [Halomicrococcus sp. NG-SE-24]|uniref:hypothetical protein n=1 Tax=Halomicrococcus sp. NG-SE-24 TaxID=3436928 RepID=UPI003D982F2B